MPVYSLQSDKEEIPYELFYFVSSNFPFQFF